MEGDMTLTSKMKRRGSFGGYTIEGEQYVLETGELGWEISASLGAGQRSQLYWIKDGGVFNATFSQFDNLTTSNRLQINGPADNMNPEEKQAVLDAIAKWEAE